jgi:hypothetical protein
VNNRSNTLTRFIPSFFGVLFYIYIIAASISAVYFNWTYARDNGFVKWLLLGEIVSTAKAVVWPYFLIASSAETASESMPRSVTNFFFANDALLKANDRPEGITPEDNIRRVHVLLLEAIDSARYIQRGELNKVYPELGDHFLDDAIGSAQLFIDAVDNRDGDLVIRSEAAHLRWQKWWNVHRTEAMQTLTTRYSKSGH